MSVVAFPPNRFTPRDISKITACFSQLAEINAACGWTRSSGDGGDDMMCLMSADWTSIFIIGRAKNGTYLYFGPNDPPIVIGKRLGPILDVLTREAFLLANGISMHS